MRKGGQVTKDGRDIIEKGLKEQNLDQYPIWED